MQKTDEKTFGLKRQILRLFLALLVVTLVLATPFNALANTDNAIDSGVSSSLNYKYFKNSIADFFQIFGITTPLHAVNSSNDSGLNNITHNSTIINNTTIIQNTTITTASQHVLNAAGKVVDKWGNPLACDISIRSSDGNVKKQNNKATQYNSLIANSDVITFDAGRSKNVSAKFRLYTGSGNGTVVLDNFGKVKPVNVKKPQFTALKYVEIHAENVSYDSVEITVTYTDEDLSGFDENKLVLYHYTNGNWVPLVTTVDQISKTLTAHVDSLSVFAIGQGSGINIYTQIDGRVNSNVTVMISGAVYYDNLTAVDGASINISIQNPAISRSVTSDSDGNFKTSFSAPSSSGNYDVMINATLDSMAINSIRSLEVTNSPLFKVIGEITVTNQDVVAPGSNITLEYGIPTGAVSDNSIITITGKTSVSGNKTYNIFTNKKVDYQDNATGIYTFVVDSLTTEEVNITSGNIITNAISYTGKSSVTENYDNYLDSLKIGSSHAVKPWDHTTWYWSNVIPLANIKYNQSQTVDTVKPISSDLTWFNFTSDVNIGFAADGLSKPANASFYVDNIKLISASGDLESTSANMTGYMGDTTDFTITSDSKGGIEYTTLTSFHGYFNATPVTTGANQTVTLSFTNDDVNDWKNVTLYYDAPKGAYNFLVIDPENDNFNYTSSCIFPPDGGDVTIPSSVVGTVHSGSTRMLSLSYSLKQLNVTSFTGKETYAPGQSIQIRTDVLYDDLPTDGAVVWVQVRDPEDVLVIDESAPLDGLNYSLTKTTDQTWKVGIYHVTVNATQTIDGVDRTGIYNTSFAEEKLIMYVQGNGPYYQYRNITIDGRAYYSDNSVPSGEFVNITVGSINTSAEVSATGDFNVTIPGFEAGAYAINATITDAEGLTDNDNDSITILDEPFFILVDSNIDEMSGQVLMTTDHTFNVTIPSGMDILSSTITLTGITEKIEDTEVTIADDYIEVIDADIGTEFLNFVNGTFVIGASPYTSVSINSAKMTLVAAPDPDSSSISELYFGSYVDDLPVNGSIKFRIDEVLGTDYQEVTFVDDITEYVSPGVTHEIKVSKLGSTAVDCNIYVIVDVNKTGYLDTPLNPRASIAGNIIYAESGDMLLSSHTVDATKFMHDSANSMYFANDRNALINYVINVKGREWNYTQETVVKPADKFEIENILYAEAPDLQYNNPEIIHPLKNFASNLTVFDMDNNIEITSENYTISNDELLIHTEAIGSISAGNVRIFNVSYDAPRPNISPSVNKTQYNPGDDVLISASINFTGSPVTDANVSAVISSATVSEIWEGTLTHMGSGVYTANYPIPANTVLGEYTVTVEAYNDALNLDSETVTYKVRRLNVSVNAGGPYVVDTNASITGFVRDLENNTGINGVPVQIKIWNGTFSYNTTITTDATGYYSLSRPVDLAGDYNVTVNSSDTNILGENNFYGEFVLWHLDEGSENKTADMSGINPGTINLGTLGNTNLSNAWVNGKIGTALNFDGVDDCIDVDSPNPGIFHDAFTERTFVGWIKTDNSSKTQTIYEEGGSGNGFAVKIESNEIKFYTRTGAEFSVGTPIDTNWHFIVAIFNNSELQLWVDDTKYSTTASYSTLNTHGSEPGIGNTSGGDASGSLTIDYFDGTMDEIRIYSRALSDDEIADRYNNRSTNYRVKYNVSVVTLQPSYTEDSLIPINVTIYDSSMIPVSGANVNYTFQIGAIHYYHNGTTDGDGKFDFIFSDTGTIGHYNVSTNVSKSGVIGNSTQSFRVSSLSITEFTDKTVYIADDNVDVWGRVYDNEAGVNASGASYNVSIWKGAQYITSSTGSTNGTGEYSVTFPGLSAGSYTANVDVTYDNIVGSKTTPFEIRYDVTTTIPKSLYGIGEQVDMNIGVFDTGSAPVIGAVLTVTITNSSGTVTTLTGPNITDNSNGYYTTNFTPGWSDDFNIAAHVVNGSVIGDAASVPFRATGFYVNTNSDISIYEAGDTVYINGSLWDSLGSSRQAHVTIKVFDSQNTEVVNVTKSDQFDNYSHNFNLASTAFAGTYSVLVDASEIESGGSLTASNSTTFDVEYIVTTSTNRTEYNTNDSVKVTVNVKNGTTAVDGTTVAVNVTNSTGGSVWSGSAGSIGSGNYTAIFTLNEASLGDYTVEATISPWTGDATSIFTVRELDITSYLYGPYNLNGTHNGPLLPLFVAGTVHDSEHGNVINGASADISIYYPNGTLAINQIVNTNDEGVYLYNFTSNFSQSPPAGLYNVTVNLSDSGITNSVADNFTIYTVDQSWQDPSWEYRIPILLYNESSSMNTSGLVGSWNFTGEKVLTIADSSGNGNLGTLYGYSVENPSFETNSKWDGGVGALEFNSTLSKNGARSGKVVSVSTAPIDPETTLFNDVTSGTALPDSSVQYKYGGWVYNEGGSGDIFVFSWDTAANRYDGTYNAISTSVQDQWTYISGTTTNIVSADDLYDIRLDSNGAAGLTTWFDDVWVNPVEPWTTGITGQALQMDGTDDYMQIPNTASMNTESFTISMWFKSDQTRVQGLAHKIAGNGWRLFMTGADGNIEFDAAGEVANIQTPATVAGEWYHVAATYDANEKMAKIYLNGKLSQQATDVLMQNNYSNPLDISSLEGSRFDGIIDNVEFYDHALSAVEIDKRYTKITVENTVFDLTLPGGSTGGTALLYDIDGNQQSATITDFGSYVNINIPPSIGIYENKIHYLYFDRPSASTPYIPSMTFISGPYYAENGNVDGYKIDITKDAPLYPQSSVAQLTANLSLIDTSPLTGAVVNFTIYYPNGTLAYGPYNNVSDSTNISQLNGSVVLSYSIPAVKGLYGMTLNATSSNGIHRTESSTFSVGGLKVLVTTDKDLYNTGENVWFTVDVSDGIATSGANVSIDVSDENNNLPYEFEASLITDANGLAQARWHVPADVQLGNYSIIVNANTANDSGYNGSQSFMVDRYELGLTTNTEIIGFNESLVISGNITHNYTNVDSYANVSVLYQNGFIDDVIPYGATAGGSWNWDYGMKHSGMRSHYQEAFDSGAGANQHYFYSAYSGYRVGTNENISFWVYIDPLSEPVDEIMFQFHTADGWEHRAYWGSDLIQWGTNDTNSRRQKGSLPTVGQWTQLNVTTTEIGLDGTVVDGMAFSLNENSSNTAKVWFDDIHFSGEATHDSYLENQNVTSTGGPYIVNIENGTLPWVGEYIVISNSSYANLSRTDVTGVMVADMNITVDAAGPYSISVGDVTVNGTVKDNRSAVARASDIWIYVTAPNDSVTLYTTTSDANGDYTYTFSTPTLTGTHDVKVTAQDAVGVVGSNYSYFDVGLYTTMSSTTGSLINVDTVQELTLNILDSSVGGSPVVGADVTINITKPDSSQDSYETPGDIIDNNDGTYTLNYVNTNITGNYTATATAVNDSYAGVSSTTFMVDEIYVSSQVGGPYVVGDTLTVTGSVGSNTRAIVYDGNANINLTYPNGSSVEYVDTSLIYSTESLTQSGTYGHSGFTNPDRINDGSTSSYAYTTTCNGDYIQVTWPENKAISRVKASYFNAYWPTSYKIQVLDSDGITWIDKKVVTGYSSGNYPKIDDRIPITMTKGVRIYYEASNSNNRIYVYEMYAYGSDEYSIEEIALPFSGNYTLNVSALDSTGIHGSSQPLNVPIQFLVSTQFDKISYDSGDNITAYIRAYNGTGYESGVDVTSQLIYVSNSTVIDTSIKSADSTGVATFNFTLPPLDTSYYVDSSVSKDGAVGSDSNITSTMNLRMWADPAEALVGHSSWPENVTPTDRRDLTIYTELLDRGGHVISDKTVNANIYRYDGVLLESITLTNDNGLYSGSYNVSGNAPEGKYWFELDDYPGVKQYFNVVEWGCTRCHIDIIPNPSSRHSSYYKHEIDGIVMEGSDGHIYPSNFSKEYVHESHPITEDTRWGTSCNYHGPTAGADYNCVKCHPEEVLPSACPDCHNSGNDRWSSTLTEDYGSDVHAGINRDVALGKSVTSANGYPTRAVDNDEKTAWVPDGVSDQIIEVDLGELYTVDGIRIAMANYKATYSIDGWNGSNWIALVSSNTYTNYGNDKTFSFVQKNVSKVRLTVSAWDKIASGSDCYGSGNSATVTQQPEVKSINVYLPNDLPATAANSTSHIACQACHGGDIPNDVQPTIPECTDCHPESSGSGMEIMPPTSTGMRQLEDYEDVSDISVAEYRSTVNSFAASGVQVAEGSNSGKLDYSISNKRGKITLTYSDVDLTNITSIKFWLYGNPSDDDTRYKISILNSKSGIWHYSTAQNFNWTGWKLVTIPITSFSQVDILYINYADTLRMQLETSVDTANSGVIYIDDLYVERQGTHTLYQEVRCGLCHNSGHDREPAPSCQTCHQTQSHGNTTASEPTICLECHYMENSNLIVRNIANGNDSTLVEIPMDGATISQCNVCHDPNEPHNKKWVRTCMDCHRESGHGAVDASYTDYEKASTCLKCHDSTHDLSTELASGDGCNGCHQFKIHGPSTLGDVYNESLHLDCMRCHGNPLNDSEPLPMGLGHPGEIHLGTTIGLESAQCLVCHGNATFSYELHTGESIDVSNTTLVDSIDSESICVDCHDPVPDFKDTNVSARDELPNEPHAPVVNGHGNVSCFVCHGHYPASLTYGNGFDCVDCHMDPSKNDIELINNTIPKNNKTSVYNNSSTILLVTSPQVLGHGNADCSACHGHSDSKLTYTGSSEADCLDCHENSSKTTLLLKYEEPKSSETEVVNNSSIQWLVTPPQVLGHGNVTCTECHTHAPSDFENTNDFLGSDCMECHGNTSRNVTLINNTIPKNSKTNVVDNSSSRFIVSAPPVLGHGNASCSACHGHTNSELTFVGGADGDCVHCHEDDTVEIELLLDSDPKSETTLIVNGTINPKLVTPPQVSGHGNVSCSVCHDHSPSDASNNATFSTVGGNCSACHKNASHEVNLINGTVPTNANTNWINSPNITPATVVAPQVFGHGRQNEVACTNCHGHTNSRLSTPAACNDCHDNISKFNELNSTYGYEPPQVAGHGNTSCDNCHSHDSPNFTFFGETDAQCLDCHVNSSTDNLNNTWNLLNNTEPSSGYTVIVNNTSSIWLVNPPQTAEHGNASCVYCHSHAPSVYDVNSMVTNGTDCMSCHVNSSAPIVPLQNNTIPDSSLTNWTNEGNQTPALVVPPQILPHGNATLNGDTNRDGESNSADCYECHGHDKQNLVEISSCMTCHGDKWPDHPTPGSNNNTNEFCMNCHNTIHKIAKSGPNCMASTCHGGDYKSVNMTWFENSVHVNINSGSNNTSVLTYEFEKACWLCHGDGSEPDQNVHLSDLTTVRTCYDSTFCHGNSSLNQNVSVEEHFVNGTDIQAITTASDNISSCIECHNLTDMKVTGAPTSGNGLKSVSHYAKNYTTISSLRDNINSTDYCLACHGNTNSIFYNASIITKTTTHGNNCSACHSAGNIHDSELTSFSGGAGISDCLDCHKDNSKPVNATVFNDSVHVNLNSGANNTTSLAYDFTKACWSCHGNGTQPTTHLSNLTAIRTCYDAAFCHGNSSLNMNVSVEEHFVNGTDIQAITTASDNISSCIECHNLTDMKVTGAPTGGNGAYQVSHYAKNYTTISSLRNNINSTDYCLACHGNTNSIFYNASIITKTTTHGNNCSACHSAGNIHDSELTSFSGGAGISDCLDCHKDNSKPVNATVFNDSVHVNLNSGANNTTSLTYDFTKACWSCHGNGTQPTTHLSDLTEVRTCYDTIYCHGNSSLNQNVSVEEHFINGTDIQASNATSNVSSCIQCHNLTEMKVTGAPTGGNGVYQVSHYAKNYTEISSLRNNINSTDYCLACHGTTNSIFYNASIITKTTTHGNNCSGCHGAGNIHDSELSSFSGEGISDCLSCHDSNAKPVNATLFSSSVHVNLNSGANNTTALTYESSKACWLCHGNGTQPTTHLTNLAEVRTCYDADYCHGNSTLNVGVSEHFLSGESIKALTGEANNADSCIACHNKTEMKVIGAPIDNSGLYSVSHFARNYTAISSLRSTTNITDYCTACHFNDTSIFKSLINTSGEHGTDCDSCHGMGKIHDASLEVPSMSGDSSECLGCHDGLSNDSVSSDEFTESIHAVVGCADCHTPRQEFKGTIVNQESRTYNFTMTPNITSLKAALDWEGGSTLGLTLHSPNGTKYKGNSINISSPQAGNWSAVIQDIVGDAPFSVIINVTMDHGILMAKDCEDCHITNFGDTPMVFKHVPQQSDVPTNASCISCHESKLSSATAMGTSHYAPRVTLDTKDCIQCHDGSAEGWGNAPDQRNHTDFAFVTKTLSADETWELVDNYTITLIETTTSAAMIDIKKDGILLKREVAGLGNNIKYEISGLGIDDTAIINVTVDQLFTAKDRYVVDLSGYMLSSHIHRETQNEQCYSCHDNEYRSNMPDGMDYYVLDKDLENVTLMEMPVNFTAGDEKTIAMGESWDLGEGYSIHIVDVSIERSNARLQLYRNETLLEDEIVSASNYITHEETLLDRDIDIFSAKVDGVFVGVSKFVVLTNVNLIAGDQKVVDGNFTLLQTAISAKYLTLDGSITVGEEPLNFHAFTVTPGGYSPDCISCHTGDGVAPIKLDLDDFKEGVHVNLNNDTTYTSFITDDVNKACWGCHGNSTGGEPDEHPTPYLGNHTPKSCITCHGNSLFGAKQIYSHYPGAEISTSGTCWDCHSNNQNNSGPQNEIAAASHYSAKKNLLNTSDCAVCHGDETNATLWGNAPMVSKHNSSNDCALCHAGEDIKTFHDMGITITRNCEDCHVDKQQAEKFNLTPILTHYPGAPEGKANTLANNDYTCRVCHNATNNSLHSGMEVREYQNESMGFCFPCHSVDGEFPHKSDTQMEEVRHGSGIKVVAGCDSCHAAEGVSKYHTPTALGKGYMRGTVKYDTECTECHSEHEGREYQPYEGIQCEDCHNEYGSVHYAGLKIGQSDTTTSTCPLCHNEEADKFHELTHIVGNVSEEAYEPCSDCHDDIDALMDYSSSASIVGGTMGTISQPALNEDLITCTSCHNSSGMNSFHYDAYPMGTVQDPGWENWTAGNVTGCKDCHTYQGGAPPFNATNMGTQGRSPAGTAHGFAPSCTICHGGDDPVGFHTLATSEFIPRLGVIIEPNVVYGGDVSLLRATVVLPQLTKLTRAEYFIDEMGRDGYGLKLEYIVGESRDSSAVLGAVIDTSDLSYGKHPIFVHVKDSSGKWSKTEVVVLTVERPGGVAAVEVILKDIVPAFGIAGLLFLVWRRFRGSMSSLLKSIYNR